MKQTTKRFLSMISSFILFAAALIVYFNLVLPANEEGQKIKAQQISRQSFIDGQKSAISKVQGLINSYKGEGQLQEVVSSILPSSPDLAGAFAQISGLIQSNGLLMQATIVSVPIVQGASGESGASASRKSLVNPFGSVDFQVRMVGSYENFKSFLGNLETNIRIFDVKRINFQQAGKPNQDTYIYDLTATTYYQTTK